MSKRDINILLEDIAEAVKKITAYTSGMSYADFTTDDKTIDAVVRNFEIIGEAANRIPEDYKIQHPEIEWRQIIGLRNRVIHEYFGIDYEILWHIIENNLSELQERVSHLLQ